MMLQKKLESASPTFRICLKTITQMTFVDYLKEVGEICDLTKERIRLAESMFMTENKKYIDIAFECGFNSVSSFNRSFKKVKGISPREFKNAMIKSL